MRGHHGSKPNKIPKHIVKLIENSNTTFQEKSHGVPEKIT